MRLLKRHRDEDVAPADRTGARRGTGSDTPAGEYPGEGTSTERAPGEPIGAAGEPTRQMATPASEPATPGGRVRGGASPFSRRAAGGETRVESRGSRWSLGPILSILAGLALIGVGIAALIRTGVNETWFRPVTEIFEADHTPLLAAIEIGAGVLLVALGLLRNRLLIAIAGIAGALLATVAAVDPQEVSRELAINRWWAWVLAGTGALLALASLHRRDERTREVETAGGARYRRRYGDYAAPA